MSEVEKVYLGWNKFDEDINGFIDFIKEKDFHKDAIILALKRAVLHHQFHYRIKWGFLFPQ